MYTVMPCKQMHALKPEIVKLWHALKPNRLG